MIKADGLAAGKGVVVAQSEDEALAAVDEMLSGRAFGDAGRRIVIEEFLAGEEASFICVVGGGEAVPLASSQDHKAALARETRDRTPAGWAPIRRRRWWMRRCTSASCARSSARRWKGSRRPELPIPGSLYAGLMIDAGGAPRVIEFNCRLGDPETQPILLRLHSDLLDLVEAAIDGELSRARGPNGTIEPRSAW